ncbi:MAG TPA: cupredoxin domain-containing protein [Acidimicrobiales bacterium]|nr:cupredoxin domain-containing protein [Acidimicrobiales bacterium]
MTRLGDRGAGPAPAATEETEGRSPPVSPAGAPAPPETTRPDAPAPGGGARPAGTTFESLAVVGFVFGLFAMVVALFALGLAARAVDEARSGGDEPAAPAGGSAPSAVSAVSLADFSIDPADVTVAQGTVLDVSNDGAVVHNLAVDGVATDMLDPGAGGELDLGGLAPGTYRMICEVPGHEAAGMHGTLVVE